MAMSGALQEPPEPSPAETPVPNGDPDSLVYGMRWPANQLTLAQMRTLRTISKDVRIPITQLLKDAVDIYISLIQREMQAIMVAESEVKPADEPALPQAVQPPPLAPPLPAPVNAESPRRSQGQLF